MKIRLTHDVMADAVAWVARSLPNRPSVPILAGMLLKADADGITFSSFDYETSAKISVPGDVIDDGVALVSGRLLNEIARSLPNRTVEVSTDSSRAEVVCGSARFTLQLLPVHDYPSLPQLPPPSGTVESTEFAKAVGQVVVAAGRDELLPVFTGVRVEIEDDRLSLLATDRYRMALKELPWRPLASQTTAALVPARVLSETSKNMSVGDHITLSLNTEAGDALLGFEGEGQSGIRQLTTRLLDGEFPKLRHLMDIKPNLSVRVKTEDIIATVKRVALVAERNTPIRMTLGDDQISFDAATGDQAQASEVLEAVVATDSGSADEKIALGFNPNYLLDALNSFDTPYIHFSFTAPGKPCLVQGLDDVDGDPKPDYKHVIMLMRLPN